MEREKRNTRARKAAAWALRWRRRHVSDNQFLLFISLLVGIFTACAGMLLKWLIGQIEELLTHEFVMTGSNWLYLVYPVVGIWLTMLFVRYVVRDDISHGVTKILFAIARKQSNIRSHNTFTSVIASAINERNNFFISYIYCFYLIVTSRISHVGAVEVVLTYLKARRIFLPA